VALRTWVGQSCPAHATSSGKVLLSELPAAELRSRLGEHLTSFTPNTVVELGVLETELGTTRERGWAAVNEELEIGLNAVSAPVRDSAGEIVAALSVSGPSYRLEPAGFDAVARLTIDAAHKIGRRLGFSG
jgi:DNA-binding IclR family transcriptional regulator